MRITEVTERAPESHAIELQEGKTYLLVFNKMLVNPADAGFIVKNLNKSGIRVIPLWVNPGEDPVKLFALEKQKEAE